MYIDNIPRSSPSERNGIEDMYYRVAQGKNALMAKKDRLRNVMNPST